METKVKVRKWIYRKIGLGSVKWNEAASNSHKRLQNFATISHFSQRPIWNTEEMCGQHWNGY
jgi:hypothetical protein